MLFILIAIFIIIAVIPFYMWFGKEKSSQYKNIKIEDLEPHLKTFLDKGFDETFLKIEDPANKRFIQFSKNNKNSKHTGLQFTYPLNSWSGKYYYIVLNALDKNNIYYTIEKTKDEKGVKEFILVDIKQNLPLAVSLVEIIFKDVYEVKKEATVNICRKHPPSK